MIIFKRILIVCYSLLCATVWLVLVFPGGIKEYLGLFGRFSFIGGLLMVPLAITIFVGMVGAWVRLEEYWKDIKTIDSSPGSSITVVLLLLMVLSVSGFFADRQVLKLIDPAFRLLSTVLGLCAIWGFGSMMANPQEAPNIEVPGGSD